MAETTAIDRLFSEAGEVLVSLGQVLQPSLQVSAGDHFRKALLLAAASYFEHRVCNSVREFVRERSPGSRLVENFVQNKAIARQYHTWFRWEDGNANSFFALFGPEFRAAMVSQMRASEDLQRAVSAFLEIGNERNRLVHQDYATFPLEKTLDEIYSLYQSALLFVERFPTALRECDTEGPNA